MDPLFSDHSPLCVKLGEEPKTSKPFRFFNSLAEHKDFLSVVTEAWNKSQQAGNMAGIWRKLKDVRRALKWLNTNEFQAVDLRVKSARQKLHDVQEQMRTTSISSQKFEEEKELKQQLEKWATIEESIYKQKSRNQWLKLGDSNTAFFFASMKNRISHNKIRSLKTNDGEIIQSREAIEKEIVGFYKGLLGSAADTIPAIQPVIIKEGNVLDRRQQLKLTEPVTAEEIQNALKGIDDQKAPDVMASIQSFLRRHGVSQVQHPSTIKDFRPISCCTVLY
ncbi:PREDICTED: uncharacterized protein LOC109234883 [Nicotiana attenuata]|uniref:uncharacterized protein LOC109234883 n=1 Tax=Nicotiana attenuata TaxID=49451 RepID=UPI0009056856|nr:PREDICTED: uncharacterized protein LOC109234883 [Nicotiana attenuata]